MVSFIIIILLEVRPQGSIKRNTRHMQETQTHIYSKTVLLLYCVNMYFVTFSSSRMHVMNHNWSATKQCLHPHSAECSRDKPPFSFVREQDSTIIIIIIINEKIKLAFSRRTARTRKSHKKHKPRKRRV